MKTKKKKLVKAITLLAKIERLLADVLEQFSVVEKSIEKNARELLLVAEASISKAKEFVSSSTPVVARHTVAKSRPHTKAKRAVRAKRLPVVHAA